MVLASVFWPQEQCYCPTTVRARMMRIIGTNVLLIERSPNPPAREVFVWTAVKSTSAQALGLTGPSSGGQSSSFHLALQLWWHSTTTEGEDIVEGESPISYSYKQEVQDCVRCHGYYDDGDADLIPSLQNYPSPGHIHFFGFRTSRHTGLDPMVCYRCHWYCLELRGEPALPPKNALPIQKRLQACGGRRRRTSVTIRG
jgi:cytochrome c553